MTTTIVEVPANITIQKTARKPSRETKQELASRYYQEEIVIVNCTYCPPCDVYIRIWESTVLRDQASRYCSGLPRSCVVFDLIEYIPESEPFEILDIVRNSEDVYDVVIDNEPF